MGRLRQFTTINLLRRDGHLLTIVHSLVVDRRRRQPVFRLIWPNMRQNFGSLNAGIVLVVTDSSMVAVVHLPMVAFARPVPRDPCLCLLLRRRRFKMLHMHPAAPEVEV